MKIISFSSQLLALAICLIRSASAWGMSSDLMAQQSSRDSLTIKPGSTPSTGQESPFRLLPPFYPHRDTAGFQLIPIYPDRSPAAVGQDVDVTPSLLAPEIIKRVDPVYPEYAKVLGLEGTVLVRIWVDERGNPKRADILKSEPEVFSQAAIDAAMQFQFKPQKSIGVLNYEFRFRLPQNR